MIGKLTPILIVDAIEPCLEFWVDRLGFAKTVEVPHGDRLGFAILVHGSIELMLQTRASIADDLPSLAEEPHGSTLYLEVSDLDRVVAAAGDVEVVVPERTTFYGAREVFVREPGGHLVGFAQHVGGAEGGEGGESGG